MKKEKISLIYKKKRINLDVMKCQGIELARGLMFRKRENAPALLFNFGRKIRVSLTSLFVFFPFYALWLDSKNKVIRVEKIRPFVPIIQADKSFNKIVEIPMNRKYSKIIKILDGGKRFKKI